MSNIANPADRASLSYRFRSKRDVFLKKFLLKIKGDRDKTTKVADLGGSAAYWERFGIDWLTNHGFEIDCYNLDENELTRDSQSSSPVRLFTGDACDMHHIDSNGYDVVHSNSVIEHLGNWDNMQRFAQEVQRLARNYYVQTPYFWSPIDPHFFKVPMIHWMPPSLRAKVHLRIGAGWAPRAETLDQAMAQAMSNFMLDRRQFTHLFPEADFRFERVLGIPKSMIAVRTDCRTGQA